MSAWTYVLFVFKISDFLFTQVKFPVKHREFATNSKAKKAITQGGDYSKLFLVR